MSECYMNEGLLSQKVMLIIMDGLGAAPVDKGNAVTLARPENLIRYWDSYPHTYLQASGPAVGLPEGIYGNSEVGHLNIGAGKVILQNLPKINRAIETGAYYSNTTLLSALQHAQTNGSNIHIIGCFSDGGVHSHIDHFLATHKFFVQRAVKNPIYFHCFTDGRDSPPKEARRFFQILNKQINDTGFGHIASIIGRAYAMDRNNNWDRTKLAYDLLTLGKGELFNNWEDALNNSYLKGFTDEYIKPSIIKKDQNVPVITSNDVILFLNYRADRALQLTEAFLSERFDSFQTKALQNIFFASMVSYRKDYPNHVIMPKEYVNLSLGRIISENGMRQLRIAESEKFPHVTYFFNGGLSIKYSGEDRIEVPSPNVPTYDRKPEMSAMEILTILKQRLNLNIYDFVVLNLANTDMVGHTGNLQACIRSVQVVDHVVDQLVKQFTSLGGTVILTADHGNVEEVIKVGTNDIDTEHSLNPVPFMIINSSLKKDNLPYGQLSDIAPTILDLMNIRKPDEMMGRSLLPANL